MNDFEGRNHGEPSDDAGELATIIKSVHCDLRKRVIGGERPDQVWNEHSSNSKRLKVYAEAMETLATQHWNKHRETRIDWIHKYISSFFSKDGTLKKLLDKSLRKFEFHSFYHKRSITTANDSSLTDEYSVVKPTEILQRVDCKSATTDDAAKSDVHNPIKCCGQSYQDFATYDKHCCEVLKSQEIMLDPTLPMVLKGGGREGETKIRTLDIGSCYGPFAEFDDLESLSVDICPANEKVLKCDFLNVNIHKKTCSNFLDGHFEVAHTEDPKSVKSIKRESFHAVVFSLLLEYMPTSEQRLQCCLNAHRCLTINGILIIVTPDSNKQHRRVQQMRDWKSTIETLGFQRCHYEKQQHLHCLVFRKVNPSGIENVLQLPDEIRSLLYIPQDFNTKLDD